MLKRYKFWVVLLAIASLFVIFKMCKMDKDKLITSNDYNFLLLDIDFNEKIKKEYLSKIKNKNYDNIDILVSEMTKELEEVNIDEKSKYRDYYENYEQILSYEKHLLSYKQLATNSLSSLRKSINERNVNDEDINPFLDYLIFKKYSLYFRSHWYCMPYLKFSDKLFLENKIDIEEVLNLEKNESQIINLFDADNNFTNYEYEHQYYSVNDKQIDFLLKKLKNGKQDTSQEFYVLYNALLKCKTKDFILIYTKM
jgi:hypothetical protein